MDLLSLLIELLLEIAKHLQNQAWLNAFARTNRYIFSIITPYIHRYNADYEQHTALAFRACHGLENVVRRSLAAKPGDINAEIGSIIPICDEPLHTPLCYALEHEQTRVIELLLDEYGADIEQHYCRPITPLARVASLGKLELIQLLVSKGANIHVEDEMRRTPLLDAAWSGDAGCADVHHTAPGDAPDEAISCLHYMVIRGNMEGVKLLVDLGVDLDTKSIREMTPMKFAVGGGHLDIASYLLARGAKVPRDRDFFVSCAHRGYLEGLNLVLDQGVSIDDEDSIALRCAAANGHVEAVRVLLDRGASR